LSIFFYFDLWGNAPSWTWKKETKTKSH
jgi:hypothetical protein